MASTTTPQRPPEATGDFDPGDFLPSSWFSELLDELIQGPAGMAVGAVNPQVSGWLRKVFDPRVETVLTGPSQKEAIEMAQQLLWEGHTGLSNAVKNYVMQPSNARELLQQDPKDLAALWALTQAVLERQGPRTPLLGRMPGAGPLTRGLSWTDSFDWQPALKTLGPRMRGGVSAGERRSIGPEERHFGYNFRAATWRPQVSEGDILATYKATPYLFSQHPSEREWLRTPDWLKAILQHIIEGFD